MRVESLKSVNSASQSGTPAAHKPGTRHRTTSFDTIMEQAQSTKIKHQPTVEETLAFLKLTQMRMMHGLFSDGDSEDRPLLDFNAGEPFSLLNAKKSQFVDRYVKLQQPSLDEPAEPCLTGRDQIERMIERVAEKVNLAPELIRSIVTVESSFNPAAVSHAGAQGLMQLMPATAEDLGVKDSFDPLENLTGGSRYLSQLLKKYSGDLDRALAAYNWGQGNVDRHGLDKMPTETRNYLAKVKQLLEQASV